MLPYRDSWITRTLLAAFFVLVLAYAYFEVRGILFGPKITIDTDLRATNERSVAIKGHADRIASLSMNGKPVPVTESGDFDEPYLLAPGLNRILLDAKDKYGHSAERVINIVYNPPDSPHLPVLESATTTATTTGAVQ